MESEAGPSANHDEHDTSEPDQGRRGSTANGEGSTGETGPRRRWWRHPVAIALWGIGSPLIAGVIGGYVHSRWIDDSVDLIRTQTESLQYQNKELAAGVNQMRESHSVLEEQLTQLKSLQVEDRVRSNLTTYGPLIWLLMNHYPDEGRLEDLHAQHRDAAVMAETYDLEEILRAETLLLSVSDDLRNICDELLRGGIPLSMSRQEYNDLIAMCGSVGVIVDDQQVGVEADGP